MDSAVALVQAYLRLNGYFTVTEHPVIAVGRDGRYRTATDMDVLAFRFPEAGRLVRGRSAAQDEEHMTVDEALGVRPGQPDMLVGEVKEGKATLNEATADPGVLRTTLVTFGCCSRADAPRIAEELVSAGHATLSDGHHIRMAMFASAVREADTSKYPVISLGPVARLLRNYIDEHWDVMRHADSKDPAFGLLTMLNKAERAGAQE